MDRVFVDTSAWVAFANQSDPDRPRVRAALMSWRGRLVTSNLVFMETVTLCLYRYGHEVAVRFGDRLRDGSTADLVRVEREDEDGAWELLRERADKTYSFTDCASFTVMRRLGLSLAIALDVDFKREGFDVLPR